MVTMKQIDDAKSIGELNDLLDQQQKEIAYSMWNGFHGKMLIGAVWTIATIALAIYTQNINYTIGIIFLSFISGLTLALVRNEPWVTPYCTGGIIATFFMMGIALLFNLSSTITYLEPVLGS